MLALFFETFTFGPEFLLSARLFAQSRAFFTLGFFLSFLSVLVLEREFEFLDAPAGW